MKRMVALCALLMLASVASAEERSWKVDHVVRIQKTGRMALKFSAGPLDFCEVLIRNMPTAEDVEKARSDPSDNSHPKMALGISNSSGRDVELRITLTLEDKDGGALMRCDRKDNVDGHATNDHTNLCWLDSIKTLDWPRVTHVRLTGTIEPK